MRSARSISGLLALATWLVCLGSAAGQPLPREGTFRQDWRCTPAMRRGLSDLESPRDRDTAACARVAGVRIGAFVEILESEREGATGDDVRLHLVTEDAGLVVTLDAQRRRFGHAPLGWIDALEVRLVPVAGAPRLVRVSVVARAGEDYASAEETSVIVDPHAALRVLWAGPGDYRQSDYFVCSRLRTTTVRVRDGILQVRSRVSHTVAPLDDDVGPDLHARLAAPCASPPRVRVDFALDAR